MLAEGRVLNGGRLPGERVLAERMGVSRTTLRTALAALEREGLVFRESGRGGGTFAARPNANWPLVSDAFEHRYERVVDRPMGAGQSLAVPAILRAQGFAAGTRVLSTAIVTADSTDAETFEIPVGSALTRIERVRLADGRPISWERMHVPTSRFPDLLDAGVGGSLWTIFEEKYGVLFGSITEHVEIVLADRPYAALLEVTLGQPMLEVTRVSRDPDGVVFEHSVDIFRGDRTRLVVEPASQSRPGHLRRTKRRSSASMNETDTGPQA